MIITPDAVVPNGAPLGPPPARLGRYVIDGMLATGGMGAVYRAHAEGPAGFFKTVVVKCIAQFHAAERETLELFLNEARLAALLAHPNIVQTFELGEEHGVYYQAMEYVEGPNLRELLTAVRERGERLPVAVASHLCAQALHGLSYAHCFRDASGEARPILHRDVSPENVILSTGGTVKVADFGIARMTSPGSRTTGLMRGKVAYMAPERLHQGESVDARCDVFSAGVMLYELLAGGRPFDGQGPLAVARAILEGRPPALRERRPEVPEALATLVHRALSRSPAARFASALELATALESFATGTGHVVTQGQLAALAQSVPQKPQAGHTRPLEGSDERPTTPAKVAAELGLPFESEELTPPPLPVAPEPTAQAMRVPWLTRSAAAALGAGLALGALLGLFNALKPEPAPEPMAEPAPAVGEAAAQAAAPALVPGPVLQPAAIPPEPRPSHGVASARPSHVPASGKGVVDLRVHPWADVEIDGRRLGTTPLEPIELSAGRHQLRLVNGELQLQRTLTFWLNPHTEQQLSVNLLTRKVTQERTGALP
jgi:serine/threonine-protein kinase